MSISMYDPTYTVSIRRSSHPGGNTKWHPTSYEVPAVIDRGVFETPAEAREWAHENLGPDHSSWTVSYCPGLDLWSQP